MKKILAILLIITAFLSGAYYYVTHRNNCNLPVSYAIGKIDPRFKVQQEKVLDVASQAADRWDSQTNQALLVYNSTASLKINLIYDSRQQELDDLNNQINDLSQDKQTVSDWRKGYENALNSFQKDLAAYNNQVDYWNSQGGAPPTIFQSLQDEKKKLDERRANLNKLASTLNLQIDNYNSNLQSINDQIGSRKNLIITQGQFDPTTNTINIYTFGDLNELELVLMHEMGHAIGLGHSNNKADVMYSFLGDQDLNDPRLSEGDLSLLRSSCNLKGSNISFKGIINNLLPNRSPTN